MDGVDFGFNMEAKDAHVETVLKGKKRKDAMLPPEVTLALQIVKLPGGGTSCVLHETEGRTGQFLDALSETEPRTVVEIAEACGKGRQRVNDLLVDNEVDGLCSRQGKRGRADLWILVPRC